jgi:restriction system protein
MAQPYYFVQIENAYLGKVRRVRGRTPREAELQANAQIARWNEQETRGRLKAAVAATKHQAAEATERAREAIEAHRSLLAGTLRSDDTLNWGPLLEPEPFPESEPAPDTTDFFAVVPRERPLVERLHLASAKKRIAMHGRAEEKKAGAEAAHGAALASWQQRRAIHDGEQADHIAETKRLKQGYETGNAPDVARYVGLALVQASFAWILPRDCAIGYEAANKSLILEAELPAPEDLPRVVEYRFVATRQEVTEKQMSDRDAARFYEDVMLQAMLRLLRFSFSCDYADRVELAVVNAWVESVDRATGKEFRACIASCEATREQLSTMDLERVEPQACFRSLRGLSGSRLIGLQPVRPIRVMNRNDPRFIAADAVLDELGSDQNLMMMEWKDFEVLVRDLFDKMFAGQGAQVEVTRASRDQGVDAVIFDPDPLMGGKTVVQAKRYRGTVPVAAVRELYGTMMNEGAGKGILVTTSHYGAGALEFAKDKPLTLIDGANLLHYLQDVGHHVRIDLTETRNDLLSDLAGADKQHPLDGMPGREAQPDAGGAEQR